MPSAAGAILVWQLAIAAAEELYYRGFVQSAGVLAFSPLSALGVGGVGVREAVPLLVSAALFGLVHTEFVGDAPPSSGATNTGSGDGGGCGDSSSDRHSRSVAAASGAVVSSVEDTKSYWFRVTAAYGALYSALYVATGHRLIAPVCAHAGLNVGLCLRDWARMRATPEAELRRIFDADTERTA